MNVATLPQIPVGWTAVVRHKLRAVAALLVLAVLLPYGAARATSLLDGNEDFKQLATLGFAQAVDGPHADGSQLNDYAWSMAWFKGKLYVGTGRFESDPNTGQPTAGQIWAYTPGGAGGASGTWALAFEAPQTILGPREFGYRWMTICNINGADYMFVSTIGTQQGNILRTKDGVTFTATTRTGMPAGTVGFRTMVCYTDANGNKTLVTSPVGKGGDATTFDTDLSDNPIALANDSPAGTGVWRNYSPLRMGDPNNDSFFTMYAVGGTLYAGVANTITGAQVWRTTGCVARFTCAPQWTKVIDAGGGRPLGTDGLALNTGVSDMMLYGNALYIGVSTSAKDRITAELWRLRSDNTFEILIGEPRLNFGANPNLPPTGPGLPANLRCGLPLEDIDGAGGANDCPPTSRRGAGLGDISNAAGGYPDGTQYYFWRLLNYAFSATDAPQGDNRLYVGTLQGGRRSSPGRVPGFDILATTNGVDFTTITNDGLGDPNQGGMRTIASSPIGLFIGGANFPNQRQDSTDPGGCDVWLGSPVPDSLPPVTTITSPPSPDEGSTLNVHSATFAWTGTDTPAPGSLPLTYAYRLDPLEPAFSAFGAAVTRSYSSLLNGTYTFFVIAKDASGNAEAPGAAPGAGNRRTFTVNAPDAPPSVTIQAAPASPNPTGNVTFVWLGSDDLTPAASLVYDYWLEPVATDVGTYKAPTTVSYTGLADGTYIFHVKAKDGANNVGAETTATFVVAHPPPPPAAPPSASAVVNAPPRGIRVAWTDVADGDRVQHPALPIGPRLQLRGARVEPARQHDVLRRHDPRREPRRWVQLPRAGVQQQRLLGVGEHQQRHGAVAGQRISHGFSGAGAWRRPRPAIFSPTPSADWAWPRTTSAWSAACRKTSCGSPVLPAPRRRDRPSKAHCARRRAAPCRLAIRYCRPARCAGVRARGRPACAGRLSFRRGVRFHLCAPALRPWAPLSSSFPD